MTFQVKEIEDWQKVAEKIATHLQYKTILLKGDLGAGKTTFTQFLLEVLGSKDTVTSPTYTIVNQYDTPNGTVYHFDLYRLKTAEEVFDIGMEEYLEEAYLNIIEWPEIFEEYLEDAFHTVSIEKHDDFREVIFM